MSALLLCVTLTLTLGLLDSLECVCRYRYRVITVLLYNPRYMVALLARFCFLISCFLLFQVQVSQLRHDSLSLRLRGVKCARILPPLYYTHTPYTATTTNATTTPVAVAHGARRVLVIGVSQHVAGSFSKTLYYILLYCCTADY